MPNHVTTRCTVTGEPETVKAFRDRMFVLAEEGSAAFDFSKIIPMPDLIRNTESGTVSEFGQKLIELRGGLHAFRSTNGIYSVHFERMRAEVGLSVDADSREVAKAYLAKNPEYEEKGRQRIQALLEHGYTDWYSWSVANWGTKWNAYTLAIIKDDPLHFTFETAWSFPMPVFEALAREYPGISFECATYDEGSNFAGRGFFNPGPAQPAFTLCDATDELYEVVYGHPPEKEDE